MRIKLSKIRYYLKYLDINFISSLNILNKLLNYIAFKLHWHNILCYIVFTESVFPPSRKPLSVYYSKAWHYKMYLL